MEITTDMTLIEPASAPDVPLVFILGTTGTFVHRRLSHSTSGFCGWVGAVKAVGGGLVM